MIPDFEAETEELTKYEMTLVPLFVRGLRDKQGKENTVSSSQIIERMAKHKLNPARVRKIINYIRVKGLVKNLVACAKGYYIETDVEKIRKYVKGLRARAAAILAVANSYGTDQLEIKL